MRTYWKAFAAAWGASAGIASLLLMIAAVNYVTGANPPDDTDSPSARSGLALHTDHRTGCQYLSALFGGVTPRLDGQGKQVGCR
ncbi:hypothetical protein [Pseudoroseomonas ludipueritiae]|uniref:Uncharacterized protein n=1 Tax=Pseudoroseomonas ludipueritiae TaxID=198093 RepID=A0ABR7R4X6_9PROT|nr:hypothetical protein [Pseudoroseomonas ludipueritiae]MBC9176786.1 hypothetical protein [Pseudoroseomonas ludipueritiae]